MAKKWDEITIEPDHEGGFSVYGHGVYESSSVLHGQARRAFLDSFSLLSDAQKAFPSADVLDYSTKEIRQACLPIAPEGWFDPMDAGENWGEDY